ncbi:MAG: hypothetical protein GYA33_14540, partial [Thermogutta sp.]|nr:hypothetical protein [Thermogutta sp.]
LAMWYFGMRALATHRAWREAAKKVEGQLAQLKAEEAVLREGDGTRRGLRQVKVELAKYGSQRGRVWFNCRPMQMAVNKTPEGSDIVQISLVFETLGLAGLTDVQELPVDSQVYLFDERAPQDGGRYVGKFRVAAVAPRQGDQPAQVVMESLSMLTPREMQLIQQAVQGAQAAEAGFTVTELLPTDDHEIFAGVDPEELARMLPPSVVNEYANDGKPSDPTNPQSPLFERKLRDYEWALSYLHYRRADLIDALAAANKDLEMLKSSLADAQREEQARDAEIAQLKQDLDRATVERDAVAGHLGKVEETLARVSARCDALIQENRQAALEIARLQAKAIELIEQRTRAMAQAGAP